MRVERLFSILIYLLHRKMVTAKELAAYFEVTTRTIYRDLETLQMSGVPIIAYSGHKGGYTLMENYALSAFTFTDEEKQQLLTSLKLQENIIGIEKTKVLEQKLLLLKNNTEMQTPYLFRDVSVYQQEINRRIQEKMSEMIKAIAAKQVIFFEYIALNGTKTNRFVYPKHLLLSNGGWYLLAYCTERKAMRQFKLTRMLDYAVLDEHIPAAFVFPDEPKNNFPTKAMETVKLKFSKASLAILYDYFLPENIMELDEEYVIVSFTLSDTSTILYFLLTFADAMEILEPLKLREKYQQMIAKISQIYS